MEADGDGDIEDLWLGFCAIEVAICYSRMLHMLSVLKLILYGFGVSVREKVGQEIKQPCCDVDHGSRSISTFSGQHMNWP